MSKPSYDEQGAVPEPVVHMDTGVVLAHEERLQHLEQARIETASRLAEVSSAVEHVGQLTLAGFERVEKNQSVIAEQIQTLVESNKGRDDKIQKVTEVLDRRANRFAWFKRNANTITVALLGAAAGVFGKGLAEALWGFLK